MVIPLHFHRNVVIIIVAVLLALSTLLLILLLSEPHLFTEEYVSDPSLEQSELPESAFLHEEEVVIIKPESAEEGVILPIEKVLFEYVEVIDGCGPHFEGECLNVRSGPGLEYPVVAQLRNDIVLKIGGKVDRDGSDWFKIVFDERLYYPERVTSDWYVAADYVEVLLDEGDRTTWEHGGATTTTKKIIVNRTEQMIYAYENGDLFMSEKISTGLQLTPTPRGTFTIFKKTPSRYMQGPFGASDQYYDLPGVPWNLYFTNGGAVIHGAYWHNSFGSTYSHGCVNLPPDRARILYGWAELGTQVIVKD